MNVGGHHIAKTRGQQRCFGDATRRCDDGVEGGGKLMPGDEAALCGEMPS